MLKNMLKTVAVLFFSLSQVVCAAETGRNEMITMKEGSSLVLDTFDPVSKWDTIAAPQAQLVVSEDKGLKGNAIVLNYTFSDTFAYALISKEFNIELPENYEFSFQLNRSMPENNFEFKLIDDKGNTFWKKFYVFAQVNKWKKQTLKKDDFSFAWGPDPSARLKNIKKIEFVVSGAKLKGSVALDDLTLTALPPSGTGAAAVKTGNDFYPRWISNEQAFWTIAGAPEDTKEILVCEDGTLEPHKRGFTLAPALFAENKLITRDVVNVSQSLEKGYLPIPAVRWSYRNLELEIKTVAAGEAGSSAGYVRYLIKNSGDKKISGKFFLAVNPYQVFPPWQNGGGISLIKRIAYSGSFIDIDGKYKVYPLSKPDRFSAQAEKDSSPEGNVIDGIRKGAVRERLSAEDSAGFASAALEYGFNLKPGESKEIYLCLPLYGAPAELKDGMADADHKRLFDAKLAETAAVWEGKVDHVELNIPDKALVDAFKANIAYNLVTKDGPGLQPGSRSYDKSWMRDGGIAAMALLEVGLTKEPRDFIEWMATFQQPSGEIPPIIDTKADDPLWEEKQNKLIEYDSQGEFIWAVAEYYRFTRDREFLERMFPNVERALKFLVDLRSKRLTDEFKNGGDDKKVLYGILPESTSHEGYYNKHSYWDDFWALKGWKDAKEMADVLGKKETAAWIAKEGAEFRKSVYDSMNLLIKMKNINFIPGCAELFDYDPTSAAGFITYCGEMENLPQAQMRNGVDRYYAELMGRVDGRNDYRMTPYEFRSVPAFILLGQKDRAWDLMNFLMKCRRPLGWNHWAEVVNSRYRFADYFGDMPHTWVGAEMLHAVRTLFVYEQGGALVLGAGIDRKWLSDPAGISVKGLPTHYGAVSYSVKKDGNALAINVSGGGADIPPAGYVFKLPDIGAAKSAEVNGKAVASTGNEIVFKSLPAEIIVKYE